MAHRYLKVIFNCWGAGGLSCSELDFPSFLLRARRVHFHISFFYGLYNIPGKNLRTTPRRRTDSDNKHSRAGDLSCQENLFLRTPSLCFPKVSHGNRRREGLILPSSGEKKSRTQEMSQKMSQSKGEARPRVQVGQLGRLESQENIKTWLCLRLCIVKADQLSSLEMGRTSQSRGFWAPPCNRREGQDSRASGSWPSLFL